MHDYGSKMQSMIAYETILSILSIYIEQGTCCFWRKVNSLNTEFINKSEDYQNAQSTL